MASRVWDDRTYGIKAKQVWRRRDGVEVEVVRVLRDDRDMSINTWGMIARVDNGARFSTISCRRLSMFTLVKDA